MKTEMSPPQSDLAPDLLLGASAISTFLFGTAEKRRAIYHLAETSRLPVFKLGSQLAARRSTLLAWIARQETNVQPMKGTMP